MTNREAPPPSDAAAARLRSARTLSDLVGHDAAALVRTSARYRLAGIAVALLVGLPLTRLAAVRPGHEGQLLGTAALVAWLTGAVLIGFGVRAGRRAGRSASALLTQQLGHPVRPVAFSTVEGWRTHLLREHDDALAGRTRPFFSVRINRPL